MITMRGTIITVAAICLAAAGARAEQAPMRIAMAVPGKIFNMLHETEDLQRRMNAQREEFQREEQDKRATIAALQTRRDQFVPGAPQFDEAHQELVRAMIEFEAWGRIMQMDVQRMQKQQMKHLFDRIQEGVGEVARQRGIHLVIADPEMPENLEMVNPEQLRMILNQRSMLYAQDLVDISDDVARHLNERYRAEGGRQ